MEVTASTHLQPPGTESHILFAVNSTIDCSVQFELSRRTPADENFSRNCGEWDCASGAPTVLNLPDRPRIAGFIKITGNEFKGFVQKIKMKLTTSTHLQPPGTELHVLFSC